MAISFLSNLSICTTSGRDYWSAFVGQLELVKDRSITEFECGREIWNHWICCSAILHLFTLACCCCCCRCWSTGRRRWKSKHQVCRLDDASVTIKDTLKVCVVIESPSDVETLKVCLFLPASCRLSIHLSRCFSVLVSQCLSFYLTKPL